MKEKNIVRYTRDQLPEDTESDMARVKSMTEADIEKAARSDPDAQPTDAKFLSRAQIVLPIPLDQDTFRWYQSREENVETTILSVLQEYKETTS